MTPTPSEREAQLPGYVLTAIKSMEPHHQTTVLDYIAALTRQEAQQEAQGAVCSPGEPAPPPSTPAQHYLAKHNGCASQDWQDGFNVCARTTPPAPVDVRVREIAGLELACAGGRWAWFHHWGEAWDGNSYPTVREANLAKRAALLAALLDGQPAGVE